MRVFVKAVSLLINGGLAIAIALIWVTSPYASGETAQAKPEELIIVDNQEVENQTLTVRRRFVKEQKELSLDDFSNEILSEINERRVSN